VTAISKPALRYVLSIAILAAGGTCPAVTRVTCDAPRDAQPQPTEYFVSLADAPAHIAHVSIRLPQFEGRTILNLPVWNALYQVRNFAAHVEDVRGDGGFGSPVDIRQTSTSTWDISGASGCAVVHYDIYLDVPGPFGSELNGEHGFFNWAMVLMYSPSLRDKHSSIRLLDVPDGWALRDLHVFGEATPGKAGDVVGVADSYDVLVDSAAEVGTFQQFSFEQDGATYHIVVRGNPSDYDSSQLQAMLKRVTRAEVDWMQDRPYAEYTFLYSFPHGPGSGGMEHAYGTAISASAAKGSVDLSRLAGLSAHEFFHLWNVKRIRPLSLEPIDYQHEQITRALWFSEGVTSTVSELMLARAGLIDEQRYRDNLADQITELEERPAHVWQSAEDSSLNAWLEGNAFYRTPQRSISYYDKGEILGVLLDLRIRELTAGDKSLRDLFHWMNEHYARQHKFFPDSAGVQEAAETVTGQSFADFFRDYVAGVKPIPYNDFFRFVGLQLASETVTVADLGFTTTANLDGQAEVATVTTGSNAARAGLLAGDRILEVNGELATGRVDRQLARILPNQVLKVRITRAGKPTKMKFTVGERQEQQYAIADLPEVTPKQRAHRTAWIHGDDEGGGVQ